MKIIFLFSALALFMTGCASLPTPEKMKADTADFKLPFLPVSDKATVYVVRPSGIGSLVRFNVFVDNEEAESEMGYTRGVQYIYFNVTPGHHKIYSVAENTDEIKIDVKANDVIFLEQEPTMGFLFARNNIRWLKDFEGKYYVKTLQPGTMYKTDKTVTKNP